MSRSRKSQVLLAHYILWGGMLLASAILVYGPEHPRRPHFVFLVLALGAAHSLSLLHRTEISDAEGCGAGRPDEQAG